MKKRSLTFIAVLAVISLLAVSVLSCDNEEETVFIIESPYEGVNWNNQFKAALHTHTTNSDGGATMLEAINAHFDQGYDVLAITDHVWQNQPDGSRRYLDLISNPLNTEWTTANNNLGFSVTTPLSHITQDRWDQVHAGTGRDNRPMIIIPDTAEFALEVGGEEMNVFFYGAEKAPPGWSTNLYGGMVAAHAAGAIFFVNHPGRTTNAQNYPPSLPADNWDQYGRPGMFSTEGVAESPTNPSNIHSWVRKYGNLFMEFPRTSLVGMEIFNREDRDSRHDRVLWDNINTLTIPEGRFVWGYANDDSHSVGGIGINYQIMLMPANTPANFRDAMVNGRSYMVTCLARNEGVIHPRTSIDRPVVSSVTVNHADETITISAQNATSIVWISEGRVIQTTTGSSSTLNLLAADITEQVGSYVRANIIGETGMAVIQPIGTRRR
jgi:hypothetical protein